MPSIATSYGQVERQRASSLSVGTLTLGAMAAVLVLACAYWLWVGLTQRTIIGDEGISIMAAQGILKHWYPMLPSGFIYDRGYLPNYLLAGSIGVFGLNDFAIMLPSLAMALGSLWLVYLFARDVLGRPLVGVAAAVLLVSLQEQTFYAISPRMYGPLQFFVLLASYSAWRGYVGGGKRFQWITFLALLGAILSHREGGALLVVIPVSVLVIQWVRGRERLPINLRFSLVGWLFLAGVYAAQIVYQVPGELPLIAAHSGISPDHAGLSLDVYLWLKHLWTLEALAPFNLVIAPIMVVIVLMWLRGVRAGENRGELYTLLLFATFAASVLLMVRSVGVRFWVPILPIYALLAMTAIAVTANWVLMRGEHRHPGGLARRAAASAALISWVLVVFFVPSGALDVVSHWSLLQRGFGPPCLNSGNTMLKCRQAQKQDIVAIRPLINENDLIISSDPWITSYYLGRVDGMLRERSESGSFTSFDSATDEYFGIQLVDTADEIIELGNLDRRVWVIVNHKAKSSSSQQSLDLLNEEYDSYSESKDLTILVNSKEFVR